MNFVKSSLLLGLVMNYLVSAQDQTTAEDVLSSLIHYYEDFEDISVDFIYQEKLKNPPSATNEIMGSLVMKDSLFVVATDGLEIRSDGVDIYMITSENQEIYKSAISESEQIPFHLLNLLNYLQNNFNAPLESPQHRLEQSTRYIKLIPFEMMDSVESVVLAVDSKTNELSSLAIENKDNTHISMVFENYVYNRGLDFHFFIFNLENYPDYTFIE